MKLNLEKARKHLNEFDFKGLFIEELGWSNPSSAATTKLQLEQDFSVRQIAQLTGVVVFEISSVKGGIPDAKTRLNIHKEISAKYHENLIIFMDSDQTQSMWYWVKRQDSKKFPMDHIFVKGQPGDLFLSKLGSLVFELVDFDEKTGDVSLLEVLSRLKQALEIERVTKKFYNEFHLQHLEFVDLIEGIPDERLRHWYASVLLNRLMFIYFLQNKYFLDNGDKDYLQNKLADSKKRGKDQYHKRFLNALFFEGFAKPKDKRSAEALKLLGEIKYLNGGLFLPHQIEQEFKDKIFIPDQAFENLYALFTRYSWNLNDIPGGKDDEINPDVLGYIFEKYINQKAFGAYYTRPEITEYLCERTIHRLLLDRVNAMGKNFTNIGDLLLRLDADLCWRLTQDTLPKLRILDPACGSAAFLVAAMKTLLNIYSAVIGRIKFLNDHRLNAWLSEIERRHPNIGYYIKKTIITENLFGVDIMEEAVEIAKIRLFLALVSSAEKTEQLEPLPNIDFNILTGNSLIGLMRVDENEFDKVQQLEMFGKSYKQVLEEKNRRIRNYRNVTCYSDNLSSMRDTIDHQKHGAINTLNLILLSEFINKLKIKFDQATWDLKKNKEGKSVKRALKVKDIEDLKPFHWGFEFDEIMHKQGGFDVIITNPPWEIFKSNAKEFFEQHSELVTKKKMDIKEFEKEQAELLKDLDIRKAWLEYLNGYPHVSFFFHTSEQYKNQISIVNGKKIGSDINLYKIFVEQCFNLLREGGQCGMLTPASLYNDLGCKQLREMLFTQCKLRSMIGLSNEKFIFDSVHHAQKFCILVFSKGGVTEIIESAFRINPREAITPQELFMFLNSIENRMYIPVNTIRKLCPDSLSVMEFKNDTDLIIAEKMLKFPLLGEEIPGKWNVKFSSEFHMTNDSYLFKTEPGKGRLPLYEGKMIWQFEHRYAEPRYWVIENEGRKEILGKESDKGQSSDYQKIRIGIRAVASNTNERTLVSTIIPPKVFCGNSVSIEGNVCVSPINKLVICGILNSVVIDFLLRMKVSQNVNLFYIYQLPIPRLTEKDTVLKQIVERVSHLICTTSEFDDLAKEVGLKSHNNGVTDPVERAKLRAELDGLIAHLYGLTEEEFAYILTTFPIVPDPVKLAARNAYRDVERGLIK
ncbi:MAG: ATP-binding protein [Candidatus Wallbacteria bacterium]|nr:ATP-binding protein [Candidatus Wallbacteria bacterium]